MTSKEFVLWLQGFTEGVHEYSISPKQWDILKGKLSEVNDVHPIRTTSGRSIGIITTPNGTTSTAYGYPSGSAWSYTDTGYNPPYTTGECLDDMKIQHNED